MSYDPAVDAAYYDPEVEAAFNAGRADTARFRLRTLGDRARSKAVVAAAVGFFGFWLAYVIGRLLVSAVLGNQLHGLNVYLRELGNHFTKHDVYNVSLLRWPDANLKSLLVFILVLSGMIAAARLAYNRETAPTPADRASARPLPRVVFTLLVCSILAALVAVSSSGQGRGADQSQVHPTSASEVQVLKNQEAAARAALNDANSKVNSAESTLSNALLALSQSTAQNNAPARKLAVAAIAEAKSARSTALAGQKKALAAFNVAHKRVTDAQLGNCKSGTHPSGDPKNPCKAGSNSGSQ